MDLLNSDSDVQKVDLCHHLPNFEKIFRVGNLLLLKQTTSNLEQGVFYLLDLQNGRLFGKSMTFYELFGNYDDLDGDLLFASTFDQCTSMSGIRKKEKRHGKMVSDGKDDDKKEDDFKTNSKQWKVAQLEAKLLDIQAQFKEYQEQVSIEEEHSEIKQQLAELSRNLKVLIESRSETDVVFTTPIVNSIQTENYSKSASTAKEDFELYQEMRLLFGNFSKLVSEVGGKLKQTVTWENTTLTSATLPKNKEKTSSYVEEEAIPCQTVVLVTFTSSKYDRWQNLICENNKYQGSWLKSALYKIEPNAQGTLPRLVLLPLNEHLLVQRNTLRFSNSIVSVNSDLNCDDGQIAMTTNDNKYIAGFTIENRIYLQDKSGSIWEHNNLGVAWEMSVKELLNCYGNSSLITAPLTLVGKPHWREIDRKVKEDTKTSLKKKKKKLNRFKLVDSMTTAAKNITSLPSSQVMNDGKIVNMTTETVTETLSTNDSDYYNLSAYNFPNDRSMVDRSGQNRISNADDSQSDLSTTSYVLITITLFAILAFIALGMMCFTRLRNFIQLDGDNLKKRSGKKTFTKMSKEMSDETMSENESKLRRKPNRDNFVDKKNGIQTEKKAETKQVKVDPMPSKARKEIATNQVDSKAAKAQNLNNLENTDGKDLGASDAKSTNLHEVVVIDAENVLQLCDKDTASRFEMMFGESKVIAQLFDIKRKFDNATELNKNDHRSGEKVKKEKLVSDLVENENKDFYDFNALSDSKSSSISSEEGALKSFDKFTEFCMKNLLKKAEIENN